MNSASLTGRLLPPMAPRQLIIPLFPLPGVVLFPHAYLPLHIFEPRYRQMVRDAADHDLKIGMAAFDVSEGDDFDEADRICSVGTVGLMESVDPLPDGRFNIFLRGLIRFRLLELVPGRTYRQARVELIPEEPGLSPTEAAARLPDILALYQYLNPQYERLFQHIITSNRPELAFAALTNNLITLLDLGFEDRQELLELDTATARFQLLSPGLDSYLTHSRLVQELLEQREELERQNHLFN